MPVNSLPRSHPSSPKDCFLTYDFSSRRMYHLSHMLGFLDQTGLQVCETIENIGLEHTLLQVQLKNQWDHSHGSHLTSYF